MPTSRILVLALVLLSLGALALPGAGQAAPAPNSSPTHAATIDLGGLFGGDEDEADENEPDENEGGPAPQAEQQPQQQSSGTSFGGLLLAVGMGAVATVFLSRWFFRLRSWARGLRGGAA
jgi:hypothetical protein